MPTFDFSVDGEPHTTTEHELTPTAILTIAGVNPGDHYLVQLEGQQQKSYKENASTPIHMHQHMRFITVFTGPTPVS